MRRILLLGNGFDIAHAKPTGYLDFSATVDAMLKMARGKKWPEKDDVYKKKNVTNQDLLTSKFMDLVYEFFHTYCRYIFKNCETYNWPCSYIKFMMMYCCCGHDMAYASVYDDCAAGKIQRDVANTLLGEFNKSENELESFFLAWERFFNIKNENIWLKFFNDAGQVKYQEKSGNEKKPDSDIQIKWADIEGNTNKVISVLNAIWKYKGDKTHLTPGEADGVFGISTNDSPISLKKVVQDWNDFVLCFESYIFIADRLHKLLTAYRKDIERPYYEVLGKRYKFDKILTFNYTDTYSEYYPRRVDGDSSKVLFVHGHVNKGELLDGNPSIIMGYDLKKDEIDSDLAEYIKPISKENRRRELGKDTELEDYLQDAGNLEIFVWGHSLGEIDYSILKKIFRYACSVKLFYPNDEVKMNLEDSWKRFVAACSDEIGNGKSLEPEYIEQGPCKWEQL